MFVLDISYLKFSLMVNYKLNDNLICAKIKEFCKFVLYTFILINDFVISY